MIFAVLLALVLLVYLPTIYATPIWDDQQLFNDVDLPKWRWRDSRGKPQWLNERWLTAASFGLTFRYAMRWTEDRRGTFTVAMCHMTNIGIHFINTLLIYGLINSVSEPVRATFAALIFAVHPLAASAVCPIISRSSILSTTFILLATLAVVTGHPFLGLLMALGAFWSKEDAIAAVPLVVALTLTILGIWWAVALMVIVVAGFLHQWRRLWALAVKLWVNSGAEMMANAGLNTQLQQPTYTATAIVENLLRWPMWLFGFGMNPDPNAKTRRVWQALLVLGICGCIYGYARLTPVGHIAFLVMFLSPWTASWFFPLPDPVAELRAYSTVLPMAILLSAAPIVLAVPLIVWLAVVAAHRAWLQQNEAQLWRWSWREGSRKVRVAVNTGAAYTRSGRLQEAFAWHNKALSVAPDNGIAYINIALFYESMAKMERGVIGQQFAQMGMINVDEQAKRTAEAAKALATAVCFARKAMANAPKDPHVRHYSSVIEKHAKSLKLEVVVE